MSKHAVMPKSDYSTTCDVIREKIGINDAIKSGELADKINDVYDAGKQAERSDFWDNYQGNGNRSNYCYAFAYEGWNDENYNPKYPIVCGDGPINGNNIFRSSGITDTKVPITIVNSAAGAFYSAEKLVTIPKLILTENSAIGTAFYIARLLENITIEGVIGKDFDISSCSKLTKDSAMSIINHLKDFSGTTTTRTLTLHTNTKALLSDEEKAIATNKGWSLA